MRRTWAWAGCGAAVIVAAGIVVTIDPSVTGLAARPDHRAALAAVAQRSGPGSEVAGGEGATGPATTVPPLPLRAPAAAARATSTAPPAVPPHLVATASVASVAVYPSPAAAGPSASLASPNSYGAPLVMLVVAERGHWLRVMLPERPNGSEGWVRADQVGLATDDMSVVVSLSAHQLEVRQGTRVVDRLPVAVGSPSSPTPTGHFYLTELLKPADAGGPYGPLAFGTSAYSNVYTHFAGGPGQVGVHGTDEPWVIGQSASHGCIRLTDAGILRLAHEVRVGTPLTVTP
ncbi:MAG: L,D-transpeptidase family protein [Acidimicrobiales bacterium]